MILSVSEQMDLFIKCVLLGILVGVFYDSLSIVRKIFVHNKITVNIEDLIFWILTTFFVFIMLLKINEGEIREYAVAGILIGYLINKMILSKYTVKVGSIILGFIMEVIVKIIGITIYPLEVVYKVLIKLLKPSEKAIIGSKKVLKRSKKNVKIKIRNVKKEIRILKTKI